MLLYMIVSLASRALMESFLDEIIATIENTKEGQGRKFRQKVMMSLAVIAGQGGGLGSWLLKILEALLVHQEFNLDFSPEWIMLLKNMKDD